MADTAKVEPQAEQTQTVGGQQAAGTVEPTFKQADVDRIVGERLTRERAKFADYDELKKFHDESEAARKTETEKLTEKAAKAEARAKDTLAQMLQAEARAAAAELGFAKPGAAVKLADLSGAVDAEGKADPAKIKSALETLKGEMPELLAQRTPQTGPTNPGRSQGKGEEEDYLPPHARARNPFQINK